MAYLSRSVCALLFLFCLTSTAQGNKSLIVHVKEAEVRQGPSFMTSVLATLPFGALVEVQMERGAWVKASTPAGETGYIHLSALADIPASTNGEGCPEDGETSPEPDRSASACTQELENSFRDQHPELSYDWIDRMEAMRVSPGQKQDFLNQGMRNDFEGAQ